MRNERRLARRAARGDRDSFAKIFRHFQQDLYRYCVAILGDPEDAEDALQNTMVKALAALPGERREIELKPWLYRIAHNESVELRRRARPVEPLADDVPAVGRGPEQSAATRQRLRDLLADVGALPERQRGALVMRELAGFDFDQIGAALDTSSGAARQVLYEARRGLQEMSEGREMECDVVTAALSAEDGRRLRRRDIRAHLRGCAACRQFAESIATRRETFAAISPLPALAAAAIVKGALSGASAGGASVGGATAGGSAVTTVAGAGMKAVSTATLLKSAAGVAAIVAVGAVAADHGHLLHGAASPPGS
ncbi:MAG TPA: sigma-70 family RNA polymerase sigma factor, partial [Solirubrobacterales bacterium]|nr:sigma-70 family RNA polymerase sigma factor [Solirubrobacterales bacterium]